MIIECLLACGHLAVIYCFGRVDELHHYDEGEIWLRNPCVNLSGVAGEGLLIVKGETLMGWGFQQRAIRWLRIWRCLTLEEGGRVELRTLEMSYAGGGWKGGIGLLGGWRRAEGGVLDYGESIGGGQHEEQR